MKSEIEVAVGQKYEDVKERSGRTLIVTRVEIQESSSGRFKARYTYATCVASTGRLVKIDTDRLRSGQYRLLGPAPITKGSVCGTPA